MARGGGAERSATTGGHGLLLRYASPFVSVGEPRWAGTITRRQCVGIKINNNNKTRVKPVAVRLHDDSAGLRVVRYGTSVCQCSSFVCIG